MDEDELQVQVLATIGHICVQWALLEAYGAQIIWALLPIKHDTGAVITGGMDMMPRFNTAIALAEHKHAPRIAIQKLKCIRQTLQDGLADRRNQAVHGIHSASDDPTKVKLTMLRWKGNKREEERSVFELHETSQDIIALQKIAHEALDIIWEWQLRSSPPKPNEQSH